jgi:hypothetical protein
MLMKYCLHVLSGVLTWRGKRLGLLESIYTGTTTTAGTSKASNRFERDPALGAGMRPRVYTQKQFAAV